MAIGEHGTTTVGCSACAGSGQINGGDHVSGGAQQAPAEIELHQVYTNPVIIAGVDSGLGVLPGPAEVLDSDDGAVQYNDGNGRRCDAAWCFDMFLQEPSCLDQWHADEQVA